MRQSIFTFILILFSIPKIYGQNSPQELGKLTFYSFKNNSFQDLFKMIPTFDEITQVSDSYNISRDSLQFITFEKEYPKVTSDFKIKCNQLRNDSSYKIKWEKSKLLKIETNVEQIHIEYNNPNSKTIEITIIKIYFNSKKRKYLLSLEDAYKYNEVWKLGNNIKLIEIRN